MPVPEAFKRTGFDARETRMCTTPAKSKSDALDDRERDERRPPNPADPTRNTRPRGNGERDDHDIDRGLERLTALVGR